MKSAANYIKYNLKNPQAAHKLINLVKLQIIERMKNPVNFQAYEPKNKLGSTYYRIYIKNYTVFYTVEENTIVVSRFLYHKRNFEDILK